MNEILDQDIQEYYNKKEGKVNLDYTEVMILMDRSGSMNSAKSDHEGGIKEFIDSQKKLPGKAVLTFVQFDGQDPCEIVHDGKLINEIEEIKLNPRGNTPLFDAIGLSLAHLENRLNNIKEKPTQVAVTIITDGYENASKEWDRAKVKERITKLEKDKGWVFQFLGANIDSSEEATSIGVNVSTSMDFNNNAAGVQGLYSAHIQNFSSVRSHYHASGTVCKELYEYNEKQRKAAKGL